MKEEEMRKRVTLLVEGKWREEAEELLKVRTERGKGEVSLSSISLFRHTYEKPKLTLSFSTAPVSALYLVNESYDGTFAGRCVKRERERTDTRVDGPLTISLEKLRTTSKAAYHSQMALILFRSGA